MKIGGGGGENGVSLDELQDMQCVVFDQQYEHEGSAFKDNNKVFLRSELIFEDKEGKARHEEEIGGLFSSAVYFTAESTFQPELAKHAHDLYERVNRAHWGLDEQKSISLLSSPLLSFPPLLLSSPRLLFLFSSFFF